MTEQIEQFEKLPELLKYRDRYEISIQFWPEQTAVYIYKDGVELASYGNPNAITRGIEYLDRITRGVEYLNRIINDWYD